MDLNEVSLDIPKVADRIIALLGGDDNWSNDVKEVMDIVTGKYCSYCWSPDSDGRCTCMRDD